MYSWREENFDNDGYKETKYFLNYENLEIGVVVYIEYTIDPLKEYEIYYYLNSGVDDPKPIKVFSVNEITLNKCKKFLENKFNELMKKANLVESTYTEDLF